METDELLYNWKEDLKTQTIASLGELKIGSKTITLLIGQSMAGKTASCLHFTNSAIEKGYKVLYVDTDLKSIMMRQEPNLFKHFYNLNKKKYDEHFFYSREEKLDVIIDNLLDKFKPNLLVIDSVYTPFLDLNSPKQRCKELKDFLYRLRDVIWEREIGVVITTPIGRVMNDMVALGGEGIKYASDVKVFIHFADDENKDNISGDKRFFVVDRQSRYGFIIKEGGIINPL